ncbi:MAG: hypothetical protein CMJ24_00415 [Phycisphaerae bacterium]|nr:hypothetical protein [Phycisphaerae bacterium]
MAGVAQADPQLWTVDDGGNGHRYEVVVPEDGITWTDARAAAEAAGGYLATLTSQAEFEFVESLDHPTKGWVGGYRTGSDWYWVTGESFEATQWCGGQPGNGGDFLQLAYGCFIADGDTPDEGEFYVIEYSDTAVQWSVETGGNGHWYAYNWDQTTDEHGVCWSEARARSLATGGDLVAVSSQAESDFLSVAICPQSAAANGNLGWLGLMPDGNGGLAWSNGEPYAWSNWGSGQPSGDGPHAAFGCDLDGSGGGGMTWNDIGGSDGCHTSGPGGLPLAFWITEYSADCNGDGIVDYGQILDGSLVDEDGDGVPDCCQDASCSVPTQWAAEDGGNGHWYIFKLAYIPWSEARAEAESLGGYLCCMETTEEWVWVRDELVEPQSDMLFSDNGWGVCIGGYQDLDSPDYSEPYGGWTWLTGEPFVCGGEFNCNMENYWGVQHNMSLVRNAGYPVQFNDIDEVPDQPYYMIEWSADCNGDGIVDYGQILDGSLVDEDGDGVPDVCDCRADLNADGIVTVNDLLIVIAQWATEGPLGDLDADGTVNVQDLLLVIQAWGTCG